MIVGWLDRFPLAVCHLLFRLATAALATAFELGCPLLLVAGLATRLATLPLLGMIAVIQLFVYPSAWPEHLTWASILLFLLTRGPGPLSIDRVIGRASSIPG